MLEKKELLNAIATSILTKVQNGTATLRANKATREAVKADPTGVVWRQWIECLFGLQDLLDAAGIATNVGYAYSWHSLVITDGTPIDAIPAHLSNVKPEVVEVPETTAGAPVANIVEIVRLGSMSVKQLRKEAATAKLKGYASMSKEALVTALSAPRPVVKAAPKAVAGDAPSVSDLAAMIAAQQEQTSLMVAMLASLK